MRYAASFTVHTPSTPSTRINITPVARRETAINRGLAKRLKDLEKERERRERANTAADEEFSTEFLLLARKAFKMIDKDDSGTLEKEEILRAVRADQEVINFLTNCGNKNLQYLLVPSRLEAALAVLDTDRDGTIDAIEWCVSEPETLWRLRRVSRGGTGGFAANWSTFRAGRKRSRPRSRPSSSSAKRPASSTPRRPARRSKNLRSSSKTPRASASSSSTRTTAGRCQSRRS